VVTGEVGEQRTLLDHAFRTVGETPDAVVDAVAQEAVAWVRNASANQISSLQLSEWIHNVVTRSVQPPLDRFRDVGERAIKSLQRIAKEMGRSDAPSEDDFALLLRDLPRFELVVPPTEISITRWKFWGEGVLRSRIRAHLRQSIVVFIKQELHIYGMALSGWSEQVVRKLEALVNSYADSYRVQLQRANGLNDESVDLEQIESDLDLLLGWSETRASELKAQQA
jgi:hypothetical protein